MSDHHDNQLADKIASLALRMLGANLADKSKWQQSLEDAAEFYKKAQQVARQATDRRYEPEFVDIETLIRKKKLGRSEEVDSVLESRIRPRFPTEKEMEEVRAHFHPAPSDTHEQIRQKAIEAANQAGTPAARMPATILALFGWVDTFDRIKESKTLRWNDTNALFSAERLIIQPTQPSTIDDVKEQIDGAIDEYLNRVLGN